MKKQHEKYRAALELAKKAAVDRNKTKEQREKMKVDAAKEQKKFIAIKNEITKVEEKKEKAKELAEEQAQEEEDVENAVELEPKEKIEIYNDLKKITFTRPSTDPKINLQKKRDAIKKAEEYRAKIQARMFKQRELMKIYAEKAKKAWAERMRQLNINRGNMMIEVKPEIKVGGSSTIAPRPIVFKATTTTIVGGNPATWGPNNQVLKPTTDPIEKKPTKIYKKLDEPKQDFKLTHKGKMCKQYNQLSISADSVETCSEMVKKNDKCKSGHGNFFYGEVNANHKECACCLGAAESIEQDKLRDNGHFNLYLVAHKHDNEKKEEEDHTDDQFKLQFKYRECGKQSRNFGPLKSPEACGAVAQENKCESFMFSHKYPVWGCRCCAKAEGGRAHKLWNVYTVDEQFTVVKKEYYKTKAKSDAVKEIIEQGKDKIMEEEIKENKVVLEHKEDVEIKSAIKKYICYRPTLRRPTSPQPKPTTGGWGNKPTTPTNKPSTGGWGKPQPKPSVDPVVKPEIKIEYKPVEIKPIGGDIKIKLKGWTPDMKKITEIKEET